MHTNFGVIANYIRGDKILAVLLDSFVGSSRTHLEEWNCALLRIVKNSSTALKIMFINLVLHFPSKISKSCQKFFQSILVFFDVCPTWYTNKLMIPSIKLVLKKIVEMGLTRLDRRGSHSYFRYLGAPLLQISSCMKSGHSLTS